MRRREILTGAATAVALGAPGLPRPAIAQAATKTLRFVPQANLANPDPVWTTATVAIDHAYLVFDTPGLAAQRPICEQIQRRAFEVIPFMPQGQIFQPTAFRNNVTGIVKAAIPLFWGVRKS